VEEEVLMGLSRLVLTGRWKRPVRKPTLWERMVLGDSDNQRRAFSRSEIVRIKRGWFSFGRTKCKRCGSTTDLHVDHRRPLSKGGTNRLGNLQWLCRACNLRKGVRW